MKTKEASKPKKEFEVRRYPMKGVVGKLAIFCDGKPGLAGLLEEDVITQIKKLKKHGCKVRRLD